MSVTIVIIIVVIVFLFLLMKMFKFAIKLLLWAIVLAGIYWIAAPFLGLTPLPDQLQAWGLPVPDFMESLPAETPQEEVPVVDPANPGGNAAAPPG